MNEEKEAWEHIAGELPPGWSAEAGYLWHKGQEKRLDKPENYGLVWMRWEAESSITRRAYAELIAPQRVREAAEREWGRVGAWQVSEDEDGSRFIVGSYVCWDDVAIGVEPDVAEGEGPDICSAAWAAIQEMKA